MSYPAERKEAVLKKMLPPSNKTIKELAKEEGISEGTLHNWRKSAHAEGRLMPNGIWPLHTSTSYIPTYGSDQAN